MPNITFDKTFYKKLMSIALPIALQSLISSSLTLLDNLMVSKLGELSLTSVGLATQIFTIQWMVVFGFCSGSATFFTQFWGVRDLKKIRKVVGIAIATCFAISLIFFSLAFFFPDFVMGLFTDSEDAIILGSSYLKIAAFNFLLIALTQPFACALRAIQQTKIPMYISIAAFTSDAICNYLFIFGKFGCPKLGVAGAALGTLIARVLEFLLTIFAVFGRKNILAGPLKDFFSFDKKFVKRVYANASVTTLNEAMWIGAVVCQNAAYGHLGITAYAAVQATVTVMDLFQMACFSVGDASLILIGEQLGQSNVKEASRISKKLIKIALILGVSMGILLALLNRPIISLFNLTYLGVFYARKMVIIRACVLPINLLNAILIAGVFRGGGDARFAAITEISFMWLYAVPAAFVFAFVFELPIYWVLLLVQIESVLKLIVMLKRYFSGKWLKNMIKGM